MNKLNLPKECEQFFDQFVHTFELFCGDTCNLPFVTSSLYQVLSSPTSEVSNFISDISKYKIDIDIDNINNGYEVAIVKIYLYDKQNKMEKEHYYQLRFILDPRYYNYCQCTPDMDGYREDKGCCGYDCDATFCTCQINMIKPLCFHKWDGCEHDFWDYEDKFYETYPELKDVNKKQELINSIKRTQKEIEFAQEQLEEYQRKLRSLDSRIKEDDNGFGDTLECGVYD